MPNSVNMTGACGSGLDRAILASNLSNTSPVQPAFPFSVLFSVCHRRWIPGATGNSVVKGRGKAGD